MNTQQQAVLPGLDDDTVGAYLRDHPDFFLRNRTLLEQLRIPHDCGDAISLLEYQVHVLRDTNTTLKTRLEELLAVARDNDRVAERLHRLTLELMHADSLDTVLFALKDSLRSGFRADYVAVRLIVAPDRAQPPELVANDLPELRWFETPFSEGRPVCGRLSTEQRAFLFGDSANDVGSDALVPIVDDTNLGLLAIGARDPQRFHPGMGTIFLRQLGALVARAVKHRLPA